MLHLILFYFSHACMIAGLCLWYGVVGLNAASIYSKVSLFVLIMLRFLCYTVKKTSELGACASVMPFFAENRLI